MAGRWWEADRTLLHGEITEAVRAIENQQQDRRQRYAYYLGLYEGRHIPSLDGLAWAESQADVIDDEDSKENVLKQAIDSIVAKIASSRPRPIVLTNAGDYELQKKAKQQTLLVEGVIADQKGYALGRQIFLDGCIWDVAAMKVYADPMAKRIRLRRVLASELLVDYLDGKDGAPKSMFQTRVVSRSELAARWKGKKYAHAVNNAQLHRELKGGSWQIDEPVSVFEAWHLPSAPGAGDGLHVISTTAGTLFVDDWEREAFPFVIWRWKKRTLGWHGMGAIEDVVQQQKQVTFLDRRIGRLLNASTTRVFAEKGSKINITDLGNDEGGFLVVEYTGTPPVFNPDPGPPQVLFSERGEKKEAIFEALGISQLFAYSRKPGSLASGEALRQYKDSESQRFLDIGQDWDDFWVEVAERILDAAADLVEAVGGEKVKLLVPRGKGLAEVLLSDLDRDRSRYMVQIRPASLLPREPAGRLSTIQEMLGIFPQAAPLLASKIDHPDVDDAMSMMTASVQAVQYDIEQLQAGKPVQPESFLDLQTAKQLVLAAYLRARNNNAPEHILEGFRQYLLSVDSMIREVQQQQMAIQMAQQQPQQQPIPGQMPPGMQ